MSVLERVAVYLSFQLSSTLAESPAGGAWGEGRTGVETLSPAGGNTKQQFSFSFPEL